jgi:hypothetical protein
LLQKLDPPLSKIPAAHPAAVLVSRITPNQERLEGHLEYLQRIIFTDAFTFCALNFFERKYSSNTLLIEEKTTR